MLRLSSLGASVAIQLLGTAGTFAVGFAIAWAQGPEAQGRYGVARTTVDLLLAIALLGLPQSLVQVLNQRDASAAAVERLSWRYSGILLTAALFGYVLIMSIPTVDKGLPYGQFDLLGLLLGALGWVLHGLQRVLMLCRGTPLQFAWLSIVPSTTLLAAVTVLLATGSQHYEWALAASGFMSVVLGGLQLRPLRTQPGWSQGTAPRLWELLHAGTPAFAQTVVMALQPWLTLLLLHYSAATAGEVGHFVFAMYVYQAFVVPAGFVAPLLLAQASRTTGAGHESEVQRPVFAALLLSCLAAATLAVLLPVLIPLLFGPAYAPALMPSVLLALSGPLIVANRLGISVLLGRGRLIQVGLLAVFRMAAVPTLLAGCLFFAESNAAASAALAWWLVEALCALALWVTYRREAQP